MRTLRLFFSKTGEAAYISHLDLQRVFSRALRISGLPVWYSQGFNPHIYMSFALPLPLGCESLCECVDVKTEAPNSDFTAYAKPLSAALPSGIDISAIQTPVNPPQAITQAEYRLAWPGQGTAVHKALAGYNALEQAMVLRKTKRSQQMANLKEVLPALALCEGEDALDARLPAGGNLNYSPLLLAGFLQQQFGLSAATAHITRRRILLENGSDFA